MIPQRTLRNELIATDLKERVTQCRKRLRLNRLMQRPSDGAITATSTTFLDAESAVRESFLCSELSSTATANANERFELMPAGEVSGVGVT